MGPFEAYEEANQIHIQTPEDVICSIDMHPAPGAEHPEKGINPILRSTALLLAASWEMREGLLGAYQSLAEWCSEYDPTIEQITELRDCIAAVLDKAKGESQHVADDDERSNGPKGGAR